MSASKDLLEKQVIIENERLAAGIEQEKVLYNELYRFYKELIDIPIKDNGSYKNEYQSKADWLITMCATILGFSAKPYLNTTALILDSYKDVIYTKLSPKKNQAFFLGVSKGNTALFADYEPRYRPVIISDGTKAVENTVYTSNNYGEYNCIADFLVYKRDENSMFIPYNTWENVQREKLSKLTTSLSELIIAERESVSLETAEIILDQEKEVLNSIKSNKAAKKISNVLILFLTIAAIYLTWKTFF